MPVAAGALLARAMPVLAIPSRSMLEDLSRVHTTPEDGARDEDYWAAVARCYTVDRTIINLNNGGVAPSAAMVQEAHKRHLDYANTIPPPIALWRQQEPRKEVVREQLARLCGVDPEEIALTRNASESLQICQLGIDLKRGDEILCCTQDYPRMLTAFRQRERREGVVLKQVEIPVPAEDPAAVVEIYRRAITERTRMILVSHIVNITGQVMPVRALAEVARSTNGGIPLIVDGAHALAHFEYSIPELGCDYYGASLHKWLGAPHGTGILFVKKDRIGGLWSLMASEEKKQSDIRKFEEIGTHPVAGFLAIADALDFHLAIGAARKQARLVYLRDRWAKRLLALNTSATPGRVRMHTSLKTSAPMLSCGIATFQLAGIDTSRLSEILWDRHSILTTAIKHEQFEGVRITPNVYTSLDQLDRFCGVVEQIVEHGLPA